MPGHIQAAFGRDFLALLGHQGDHVGFDPQRDRLHLGGRRHLEVEAAADHLTQHLHIPVLDVAPVLTQVHRDAVGAPQFGQ